MMNITESDFIKEKTAVALGIFDGVHCGHRKIIKRTAGYLDNRLIPAVFTFNVESIGVKRGKEYEYIYNDGQKCEILQRLGTKYIYSPDIKEICNMNGEDFARKILADKLNAKAVVCGENFRFGKDALCGAKELKQFGEKFGFEVSICKIEKKYNSEISSEIIRNLLKNGDISAANELLWEAYYINSEVVTGNKLGRTLNFPTINQLFSKNQLVPKKGVYQTFTVIDGKCYNSVTNIGVKPTIEKNISPLAETHILDYNGDLYGRNIEVRFLYFVRNEKKFGSVEELKKQVDADIVYIRKRNEGMAMQKLAGKD